MVIISLTISFFVSLITCLMFVFFWRRRIRRDLEIESIIKNLRSEIGEMVTALNGTTERNVALLENKIHMVNNLVEKAGKATGVLKREQEKQEAVVQVYTSLARSKALKINVEEPTSVELPKIDFDSLSVREKALFLHRKGDTPESIASRLEMSRGEIELIISLHERRL